MSDVAKIIADLAAAKTFGRREAETDSGAVTAMNIAGALFNLAKLSGTMDVDAKAALDRACRAHGVTMPRLLSASPTSTVHLLKAGFAVCGLLGRVVPGEWPAGNKWTAEPGRVTCDSCRARLGAYGTGGRSR